MKSKINIKLWLIFGFTLMFLSSVFSQEKKQKPVNEFHVSVNHGIPLSSLERTFFGVGLGVSHVFHSEKVAAFRTGLEFQFFHAWAGSLADHSHYSSSSNVHYSYVDFTIPLLLRINISWAFIELGVCFGTNLFGQERATVTSYYDYQPSIQTTGKRAWNPGISAGPVAGIGILIPLNEKLDLLIRPDAGVSAYFREEQYMNLYARLCVGIHLK
ncbi:hypothetical protein [Fluviicola sp.]|jgi:hypothetical protein|uniref:hypothetical protein n=1 Tax=Fluviicola sp. TaxID=1917219 RepID=UPI0028358905|nr:hypothetical protein [Fluviicola sp.]MDR0803201.1 hypothetical protein [Fluviicola sp.]